ncbi:MAG TPA: 3-hydroxyacyl-ACP dehydratase FabZ [Dokdonella sp.]|uniref:3-hydroxyacyl-ACP dehydratase FabZ n=1 Tax=Dokdonella sp. TaxID=2291710 RepID=UPI002B532E2F|nr:3-hydroxyacyl-ACP dehydratase FabZ [Dokdonella sp.]HUD42222.1 3-hydroxyacyl-ACP dehydratase FabZ [Dokdonella sp.]
MNDVVNTAAAPEALPIGVERIAEILPHRYPFLLVDRVLDYTPGKKITAMKNVTINEPFFQGHFPGHPVMPGVLMIEAMAQTSGLLVHLSIKHDPNQPKLFYLVRVDQARFSRIVGPGDQLIFQVEQKRLMRGMGKYWCEALVDGKLVAEAELLCAERNGR